ncbi:unnamed protein product [Agarophyton chilense]
MVVDRFQASPARARSGTASRIPRPSARRSSRGGDEPTTPSRSNTAASPRLSSRAPSESTTPSRSTALPHPRRSSRSAKDPKTPSRHGVSTPTRRQTAAAESGIPNPRRVSGVGNVVPRANTASRLRTPGKDRSDPSRLPTKSPRALPDRGTPTLSSVAPSPSRAPLQASPYARRTSTGGARNNVNRKLNMSDANLRRASGASSTRLASQKQRGTKSFLADRRDSSSAASRRESLTGNDNLTARRESLAARRESLAARRESLAARREALKAGRESLPDRRDPTSDLTEPNSARRDSITARRDSITTGRRDSITTGRRDSLTARRDSLTARRDSLTARRDSLTARRDQPSARRDQPSARRDQPSARRDSLTTGHDSLAARRDSLTTGHDSLAARRDSLNSRRDSAGRRISSGSARLQAGLTALESFRAARRASLQAQELDGENTEPAPLQTEVPKEERPELPSDNITYPDRLDPIVPSSYPSRKGRTISERFNDSDINLENVERLRRSLGGRRSIGPNEEMPKEVPQLRRNSLESYMDDGQLREDVTPEGVDGITKGVENLHCANDSIDHDQASRRQRSPLRSIEANTDVPKATEWLSKRYSTSNGEKRRSSILVPDIDDEKAGWPTDDEDVEDLGAW